MTAARYLVTGGAGFIGSHIAAALAARGEHVRIFDNLATGREANLAAVAEAGSVEVVHGDLRELDAVRAAMAGVDVVFHEAALASVPRSIAEPIASLESNVNGTQHVLLAAREAGVRRLIYASSSSVYGNTPFLPKQEKMPTSPLSPYAIQKLAGEQLCLAYHRLFGLETVALRYFNVFGPRQDPASQYAAVIPRFITALLEGRRPVVFGDGEQTRDFTYVENVVQANLLAVEAPEAPGHAINIGSGARVSLNETLRLVSGLIGASVDVEYQAPRAGDVRDSLADIALAHSLLGYAPTVSFREGLARTINAMRTSRMSAAK